MNFKHIFWAIVTVIGLVSCGALQEERAVIAGSVTVDDAITRNAKAPVFVAIAKDSDMEAIQNDPANTIIAVIHTDSTGSYSIECKDYGLKAGDEVLLFAFIDNDYTGGIPFPSPGDAVGFYYNGFKLSYTVGVDGPADILINRQQYDFDAKIIGILDGTESGNVILIAYAGDFNSSNFSDIDIDAVIGYRKLAKPAYPVSFSLPVMPYGYNVPVGGVYVIALLDVNNNGIPDEGDKIGFAVESGSNTPVAITVTQGVVSASTLKFLMSIYGEPQTNEPPLTITGQFDTPEGYSSDPLSKPVFIVVAKGSDPNEVFANIKNLNTQTFDFIRVPQGENTFALTLSRSKFNPGDSVFIFALWDRDFKGGFPFATQNDIVGFVINKENFAYTLPLQNGTNELTKNTNGYEFNDQGGFSFSLDRIIYNHQAEVRFQVDKGDLSDSEFNDANVICAAIYETNENIINAISSGTYELDIDKIIAVTKVNIMTQNNSMTTSYYTMPVMPALHKSIPAMKNGELYLDNIWVVGILDANNNGKPDSGEKLGIFCIKITLPLQITQEQIVQAIQSFLLQVFGIDVTQEQIEQILEQFPIEIREETIEAYIPSKLLSPISNGINYLPYPVRFFNIEYNSQ